MNRFLFSSCAWLIHVLAIAQTAEMDSTDYTNTLHHGLYLSPDDFVNNTPIDPSLIDNDLDSQKSNFYHLLFKETEVRYEANTKLTSVASARVWGYFDGKVVYINKNLFRVFGDVPDQMLKYSMGAVGQMDLSNHMFTRINFIGSLCYIQYVKIHGTGSAAISSTQNTLKEYIFDTRTKSFFAANLRKLKELISDDPVIVNEFNNFKGHRDVKFHTVLKRYNERHPLNIK